MTAFPDIDVSPLFTDDDAAIGHTAELIAAACREHGFFLMSGHGVSQGLIDAVDGVTRDFFALPLEAKEQVGARTDAGWLGFRGLGRTMTAASLAQDTPTDLVETFGTKSPDPANVYSGCNVWPTEPTEFRELWTAYSGEMVRLMRALLRAFEIALELPAGWFDDKFDAHFSGLKANYYPAQVDDPLPGQLRRGAHTDYGFMTLLYQDDAPGGLQVETMPGVWVDVPHVPGTFVVNVADLLSHWTNNRWTSSMHRVTNPPRTGAPTDRVSIPFFVNPNQDAVVECVPSCADGTEGQPVVAGPWVAAKVARATEPAMT